jgi:hypothetical protein
MLDRFVLRHRNFGMTGSPFVDEVEDAKRLAQEWAEVWFDHQQARAWLNLHPQIKPATAAAIAGVGLTPEQASERIWYGKRHPDRPTLAELVTRGDITAKQARDQFRLLPP